MALPLICGQPLIQYQTVLIDSKSAGWHAGWLNEIVFVFVFVVVIIGAAVAALRSVLSLCRLSHFIFGRLFGYFCKS